MPTWMDREVSRFDTGVYTLVPWHGQTWWNTPTAGQIHGLHYAHVSNNDRTKLAYTKSPDHGTADRQTRTKPGKYLTKHFSDTLTAQEIAELATEWEACLNTPELQFAMTPDEIEAVYREGPGSCMSHEAGHWETEGLHPTRVYGAGDLGIAYVRNGDNRIQARVLAWPEKKIHNGRIYGDTQGLSQALETAGFTRGGLDGARLLKISLDSGCGDRFLCPYIDGESVDANTGSDIFMLIGGGLDTNQKGFIGSYGTECERCGDGYDSDSEGAYVQEESWCQDCYENYAGSCESCCEQYHVDNIETVKGGRFEEEWCDDCRSSGAIECDGCHDNYKDESGIRLNDGTDYCPDCAEECAQCGICEDWYSADDVMVTEDSEVRCDECGTHCAKCDAGLDASDVDAEGMCEDCQEDPECPDCGQEVDAADCDTEGRCEACAEIEGKQGKLFDSTPAGDVATDGA